MTKKQFIYFFLIAFFVGAIGSIVFSRFVFPYLGTIHGFSWVNKLVTSSPIIVNRTESVQLNEGVNLIDLIKQSGNVVVSIYNNSASAPQFLGNGMIATSDGLILSSDSVVGTQTQVNVILNDGRQFVGLVRAKDPKSGMVAVTISGQNLPVAQFDKAGDLQSGQRLLYLGRSNTELTHEFQTGFVTKTLANSVASLTNVDYSEQLNESFATDITLSADLWGGPIFNLTGHVVGIVLNNSQIILSENIQPALNSYLSLGKITRPGLGLKYFVLSKELAALKGFANAGALVVSVDRTSPSEVAGLKPNDLITAVEGQSLDTNSFEQALNSHSISDMKLTVWRAGTTFELTPKLIAK